MPMSSKRERPDNSKQKKKTYKSMPYYPFPSTNQ